MTAWAARAERNGIAFSNFTLLFSLAADIQWIRLPIGKVIYGGSPIQTAESDLLY